MLDLESRLPHDTTNLEEQVTVWEFLHLEFDADFNRVLHTDSNVVRVVLLQQAKIGDLAQRS
jgi:hypothetical protein